MNRDSLAKALGFFGIGLVIVSLVLMAMGRIGYMLFWAMIVVGAFLGFVIIPKLRGESSAFLDWLEMKK